MIKKTSTRSNNSTSPTTKESSYCSWKWYCHSGYQFWFWATIRIIIVLFMIIGAFFYGMTYGFEKFCQSLDYGSPYIWRGYMMGGNNFQRIPSNRGNFLPPQTRVMSPAALSSLSRYTSSWVINTGSTRASSENAWSWTVTTTSTGKIQPITIKKVVVGKKLAK